MVRRGMFIAGAFLLLIAAIGLAKNVIWPAAIQAANQGGPAEQNPQQRKGLFDALNDMVDSLPGEDLEEMDVVRGELKDALAGAAPAWENLKAQNREAIRQMNRQVRVPRRSPNVLLITIDGLRMTDVAAYRADLAAMSGQDASASPAIATPTLDALAMTGVRFTNYYAGASTPAAADASMTTGVHTGHSLLRADDPAITLAERAETLGEIMWNGGFDTAFIGAWSLGELDTVGDPNWQGYDYAFGYLNRDAATDYYPEALWRNGQQVDFVGNVDGGETLDAHELLTQDALAYLDQQGGRRPFFLHVDFPMPAAAAGEHRDLGDYANTDWPLEAQQYAAMVTDIDYAVRRIVQRLSELRLDANTVVILAGDAAPSNSGADFFAGGSPFRSEARSLFEGQLRAPLIVSWPGPLPADVVSDEPCAAWDLMPTIAEMTGTYRLPVTVDGEDIFYAMYDAPMGDRGLYFEKHDGGFAQAMRLGKWKAVRGGMNAPMALYDLEADPAETNNVAGDNDEIVQIIDRLMDEAHNESTIWPVQ